MGGEPSGATCTDVLPLFSSVPSASRSSEESKQKILTQLDTKRDSQACQPTTVGLICAIQTVPLSITEKLCRQAATSIVTVVMADVRLLHAAQLIRTVLALRHVVTHLVLTNTLPPMGTLELIYLDAKFDMRITGTFGCLHLFHCGVKIATHLAYRLHF